MHIIEYISQKIPSEFFDSVLVFFISFDVLSFPCSMLVGASFLLLVDDVSRNLLATEIPIGILTAVIGAPFFIWLLLRKEKTL